ncbi:hypothetical protein ABIB81_006091 [Bradyrhizobium sp. I1.7.5]
MPLLLKHLSRPRQHALQHDPTEQVGVAAEFAAYVADDAAEIGLEFTQGPVVALELFGEGVALVLDQRDLAHPGIGLAQLDTMSLRSPDQSRVRFSSLA